MNKRRVILQPLSDFTFRKSSKCYGISGKLFQAHEARMSSRCTTCTWESSNLLRESPIVSYCLSWLNGLWVAGTGVSGCTASQVSEIVPGEEGGRRECEKMVLIMPYLAKRFGLSSITQFCLFVFMAESTPSPCFVLRNICTEELTGALFVDFNLLHWSDATHCPFASGNRSLSRPTSWFKSFWSSQLLRW